MIENSKTGKCQRKWEKSEAVALRQGDFGKAAKFRSLSLTVVTSSVSSSNRSSWLNL